MSEATWELAQRLKNAPKVVQDFHYRYPHHCRRVRRLCLLVGRGRASHTPDLLARRYDRRGLVSRTAVRIFERPYLDNVENIDVKLIGFEPITLQYREVITMN